MTERILVTGGAGFIGSHIVDALVAEGYLVRVFDILEPQVHGTLREERDWPGYANPEAEYVLGDIRDRDSLRKALMEIDVIFHQAAMVGVAQSMYQIDRYVDVNSRGTALLLDVCVNNTSIRDRLRKVVVASSMSIYGEGAYRCSVHGHVFPSVRSDTKLAEGDWELHCPAAVNSLGATCNRKLEPIGTTEDKGLHATSVYAISKKDQEELSLRVGQAYRIPTVALRYFNVYGRRQALSNPYTGVAAIFSGRLLNEKAPILFEDGRQTRDFIHVRDVVQANLLALTCSDMDYDAFNVGTGEPTSILGMAEALIELLESPVKPQIVGQYRAGDIRHCVSNPGRLQVHGFRPSISFREGMADLVSWVKSQAAADRFESARQELVERGLAG